VSRASVLDCGGAAPLSHEPNTGAKTGTVPLEKQRGSAAVQNLAVEVIRAGSATALRACFENGARLCRRPAAARDGTEGHGTSGVRCGWSRTTQPRSGSRHALSRNDAIEMHGEHSRPGCGSVRPRAEHERTATHQTGCVSGAHERAARARPAAPEAGALLIPTASFRLSEILK